MTTRLGVAHSALLQPNSGHTDPSWESVDVTMREFYEE